MTSALSLITFINELSYYHKMKNEHTQKLKNEKTIECFSTAMEIYMHVTVVPYSHILFLKITHNLMEAI